MKPIDTTKEHAFMATFMGEKFYPGDLDKNYYDIVDIAHGLGKAERFGNQADIFLSVAQHSVHVSELVSPEFALHGLFHDASEAYTNDMPKPIKNFLPDFQKFEKELSKSIYRRWGLPEELPDEVNAIDSRIVIDEALVVFRYTPEWAEKNRKEALNFPVTPWTKEEAMVRWYQRYLELVNSLRIKKLLRIAE